MENSGRWLEARFVLNDIESDVMVALLSELPFNSFMEDGTELLAYIERSLLDDYVLSELKDITQNYNVSYTLADLPDKDWNKEWESNFDPVFVENICTIIAPFHENTKILGQRIVLSPKMAFGTGHHYTTHGMIVQMNNLDMKHKKVLDFGSGTGLLAIFASIKGASDILAIDIEPPSYDNMIENFELNNISNAKPALGGKEMIPVDMVFDVILANITANVILDSLFELARSLKSGGTILFSGFFESNLDDISQASAELCLIYVQHTVNGGWVVARFFKE